MSWRPRAGDFILAFMSLACSLYAVLNKRGSGGPTGAPGSLISQEQLVRKAASLCYLLSNEGTISLVSEGSSCYLFSLEHLHENKPSLFFS